MTPFEYVIVLISIILGLGITTILTGVASWMRSGTAGRKVYLPYVIWIVLVFVLHFHEWWQSYSLMQLTDWSLLLFLFLILYPIVLYLLATLLFPNQAASDFDSRIYYGENWRKFFIAVLGLVLLSFLQNIFVSDLPLQSQFVHLFLFFVLLVLLLKKNVSEQVHIVLAIILLLVMIFALVVNREMLTIKV